MNRFRSRGARAAALVALTLAGTLLAIQPAGAHHNPPTTVANSAPGSHWLIGRNHDRVAATNEGTLDCEGGMQFSAGSGRLWAKCSTSVNEIVAQFSRLHYQELDSAGRVTQQFRADSQRGPTHTSGPRTVYYVGGWHPLHPNTSSIRVSYYVYARAAGTLLETRSLKCVASWLVDRSGAVVSGPAC